MLVFFPLHQSTGFSSHLILGNEDSCQNSTVLWFAAITKKLGWKTPLKILEVHDAGGGVKVFGVNQVPHGLLQLCTTYL